MSEGTTVGTHWTMLTLDNVRKGYRRAKGPLLPVLDLPHFGLLAGEQVALVGASGGGKTTLLHLIAGLLRPDSGTIRIADTEITALDEPSLDRFRGRHIGCIFQTFNLLQGLTALENVALATAFSRGRGGRADAGDLLERVGLGDRLGHRPAELSVGQQQRVAVARALVGSPSLVLADEPTGSLDPDRADEALALLREVCQERGAALLLVSHDPRVLAGFERVANLAQLNQVAFEVAP